MTTTYLPPVLTTIYLLTLIQSGHSGMEDGKCYTCVRSPNYGCADYYTKTPSNSFVRKCTSFVMGDKSSTLTGTFYFRVRPPIEEEEKSSDKPYSQRQDGTACANSVHDTYVFGEPARIAAGGWAWSMQFNNMGRGPPPVRSRFDSGFIATCDEVKPMDAKEMDKVCKTYLPAEPCVCDDDYCRKEVPVSTTPFNYNGSSSNFISTWWWQTVLLLEWAYSMLY